VWRRRRRCSTEYSTLCMVWRREVQYSTLYIVWRREVQYSTLYAVHSLHSLHYTPYIIHRTPYTIHHTPHTTHHTPCTIRPTPYTSHRALTFISASHSYTHRTAGVDDFERFLPGPPTAPGRSTALAASVAVSI
jgi:hypothetical protein